jgi:uncharacterized membrane protein (DUF2068 family)
MSPQSSDPAQPAGAATAAPAQPEARPAPATSGPAVQPRAPTLYAIAGFKLVKGALLLLLALGVYSLSDENLPELFRRLLTWLHVDPERKLFAELAAQLGRITPQNVLWVAVVTGAYGGFCCVEGVGLLLRIGWAAYLAISESALFIPVELYELARRPSLKFVVILVLNVAIVWYLLANRHRLFRHHHLLKHQPR